MVVVEPEGAEKRQASPEEKVKALDAKDPKQTSEDVHEYVQLLSFNGESAAWRRALQIHW